MIIFYDYEFNRLLAETKVISWQLTKYFNGVGIFSAHLPLSSEATRLVAENDYLVCKVGDEFMLVTGKEIGNELVIYGRTINWLLTRRVLLPFSEVTKRTGEFVQGIFEDAYKDCESVVFGDFYAGDEQSISSDSPKPLANGIFDALSLCNLGNEMVFDTKNRRIVFNILKGEDKNLLISEANKNASSVKIIQNISEHANLCYYEGENGYLTAGDGGEGLYRFETYVTSDKEEDAISRLDKMKKENTLNLTAQGLEYNKDYRLGDTVRLQIIKGDYRTCKRVKIIGVEKSAGPAGYREMPIFENV